MEYRKEQLVNNEHYHVFNRSIAKYIIFNDENDYQRMLEIMDLFRYTNFQHQFFKFKELTIENQKNILNQLRTDSPLYVDVIAFCLMPNHIHLVLKQLSENGISKYVSRLLNSYSRYFNIRHNRKGPLWEGRFKSVLVKTDEQLLHLTRYIHLNPTSAGLIQKPELWKFSSYNEYIDLKSEKICTLNTLPDINTENYKKFTEDQKAYQRELQIIKNNLID